MANAVCQTRIPCILMRGGTSKGLYIFEKDLPERVEERDELLLRLMGSPDLKQINGLGGATSVTSKVAILSASPREDIDVEYTFAQVSVDKPLVSYKGNCGNISSGVGPFAIERGLVKVQEPVTSVRILNTNTGKVIVSEVQVQNGQVQYAGDFAIAGVPGTGAPVKLNFRKPSGTMNGKLLPTGNVTDILDVPGKGTFTVSIVDAANPLVFVKAADINLTGAELPKDIDANPDLLAFLEEIRGMAAVKLGLIDDFKTSAWETPGIPKMTFVAPPAQYETTTGTTMHEQDTDLLSRMMSMQKTHPTYAMTGAMCTAAAAVIEGSVVNQVLRPEADTSFIRIGHPGGILEAGVDYTRNDSGETIVDNAFGFRTARLLMDGFAYC